MDKGVRVISGRFIWVCIHLGSELSWVISFNEGFKVTYKEHLIYTLFLCLLFPNLLYTASTITRHRFSKIQRNLSWFVYSLCVFLPDPARVVNMPSVIYVAISLPGFIRCPVDATPPVTLVKWKKDGLPLRIDKVSWCAVSTPLTSDWKRHVFSWSFIWFYFSYHPLVFRTLLCLLFQWKDSVSLI